MQSQGNRNTLIDIMEKLIECKCLEAVMGNFLLSLFVHEVTSFHSSIQRRDYKQSYGGGDRH